MAKEVIIYSQPGCPPCQAEKEYLKSKGISFIVKDIREKREYLEELVKMGFNSTPVTLIDGKPYAGFIPAELDKLLA